MSGIMVIARDDGVQISRAEAEAVFRALDHRGVDGRTMLVDRATAVGFQRFWTTPEEEGEEQPLVDDRRGLIFMLDGRLDNRAELAAALDLDAATLAGISDAKLAFTAYRRWGDTCFERFLGPFAVAVLDPALGRIVCARGPLGQRSLYFSSRGRLVVIASEAAAVAAHPEVSGELDRTTIARYLAVLGPLPGSTFFARVEEVQPGEVATFGRTRVQRRLFWSADEAAARDPEVWRSDRTAVEAFRETLTAAVRCRLRSRGPNAVLMSGGLDSTSVAALASHLRGADDPPLHSISWVFDELPLADERRWIEPVEERFGLVPHHVTGDGLWPFLDDESWPHNPNGPTETPYQLLYQRAYAIVRDIGGRTLLGGEFGDHLYVGGEFWLADALAHHRFALAAGAVASEIVTGHRVHEARRFRMRSAIGRLLGVHRRGGGDPRPWLTPEARRLALENEDHTRPTNRRQRVSSVLLEPTMAFNHGLVAGSLHRERVDPRQPYLDRRLVELALTMPAHFAYRRVWVKWILRQAVTGLLPEITRRRRQISSLGSLFERGLAEREVDRVRRLLDPDRSHWPEFVRPEWVESSVPAALARSDLPVVAVWHCLCLERWLRTRAS